MSTLPKIDFDTFLILRDGRDKRYYRPENVDITELARKGLVRIASRGRIESKEMDWFGPANTVEFTERGKELIHRMEHVIEHAFGFNNPCCWIERKKVKELAIWPYGRRRVLILPEDLPKFESGELQIDEKYRTKTLPKSIKGSPRNFERSI